MTATITIDPYLFSLWIVILCAFLTCVLAGALLLCCAQLLAPPARAQQQSNIATVNNNSNGNSIHVSNRAHEVNLVPVYSTSPPQQQQQQQQAPNSQRLAQPQHQNQNQNQHSEIVMSAYGPQERLQAGIVDQSPQQQQQSSTPREIEGEAYQILQKRPPSQIVHRPTAGQQLFGGLGGNNGGVGGNALAAAGGMQASRELPPLPADDEARNYTVVPPVQQMNDAAMLKERLRQKLARVNADLANNSPSDEALNMYNNFPRPPPARDEAPAEYRLQRPAPKGPRTPRESAEMDPMPDEAGGEYTDVRAKPRIAAAVGAPSKQQQQKSSNSNRQGRSKPSF